MTRDPKAHPERHENFPSAVESVFLFLALFLAEYVLCLALYDLRSVLDLSRSQLMALVMVLGNGLVLSALLHFKRMSYRSLLHPSTTSPWATTVFLVPLVVLLMPAMLLGLSSMVEWVEVLFPLSNAERAMFSQMDGQDLAVALAVCVLAPVVEEMLFRGVVLRSFLRQYDRRQAIWGSALLFGVAHLNIYQFVVALGMGLVLGWLYERSRSLIPCIALHAAYNTGAMVLGAALGEASDASLMSVPASAWCAALGGGRLAGCAGAAASAGQSGDMMQPAYSYRSDARVPPFADDKPVIVFDGHCVLCSGWANFVLKHDRRRVYRLLAAQTPLGQALYAHYGLGGDDYQSNLLIASGQVFIKSEGSIRMAEGLGWPWRAAAVLRLLPLPWRDALYSWVARNRLRWFGRQDVCYLPRPEDADRFVAGDVP